jgi:hypothetical protein
MGDRDDVAAAVATERNRVKLAQYEIRQQAMRARVARAVLAGELDAEVEDLDVRLAAMQMARMHR